MLPFLMEFPMRSLRILWLLPVILAVGCNQPSGKAPTTTPAATTPATTPSTTPAATTPGATTTPPNTPEVKAILTSKGDAEAAVEAVLLPPPPGAIVITPENSKIEFVGTKPNGKHDGGFKKFLGGIEATDKAVSKVSVEIDTNSLFSDNPKLTGHLKTPDFFDVVSHPKASFNSTSIKAEAGKVETHTITGDLTLHGVTKSISFPARIDATADSVNIASEFKISRYDFGMNYGKGKVDEQVTIKVAVKAPRK